MMAEAVQPDLTAMTVQLLSAYVSNNSVPSNELAELIARTRAALAGDAAQPVETAPEHVPAVTARKSLASPDHILSMIDGKPYKSLKRHLTRHGLTPAEYRDRYKLAADYPMVARGYSEQRRAVAERLGLGRRRVPNAATEAPEAEAPGSEAATAQRPALDVAPVEVTSTPAPAKRGRKPAASSPAETPKEGGKPRRKAAVKADPAAKADAVAAPVRKVRGKAAAAKAGAVSDADAVTPTRLRAGRKPKATPPATQLATEA